MAPRAVASSSSLLMLLLVMVLLILSSAQSQNRDDDLSQNSATWGNNATPQSNHHHLRSDHHAITTTSATEPPAPAVEKRKRAKIYYREGTAYDRRQLKAPHDRDLSTTFTSYFEPQMTTTIMPEQVYQKGTGHDEIFTIQHTIDGASSADLDGVPFEVVFAIDTSNSSQSYDPTGKRLYQCKSFIGKLDPSHDRVGAVSWNEFVTSSKLLSADFDAIRSEIDSYFGTGQYTSHLDVGLDEAVKILDASTWTESIKAIVFVTNGYEDYTSSSSTASGPIKQAMAKGYRVYPIGLLDTGSTLNDLAIMAPLQDMATATNEGKVYTVTSSVEMEVPFEGAYNDMMALLDQKCPTNVGVMDVLADGTEVDPASISPTPTSTSLNTIRWENLEAASSGPYFCGEKPSLNLTYSASSSTAGLPVKVSSTELFKHEGASCGAACRKTYNRGEHSINVIPTTTNMTLAVGSNLTETNAYIPLETIINYEINYTNSGNTDLSGVVLRSIHSPHLQLLPGHGGYYTSSTRTVTWAIGNLLAETNGTKHLMAELISRADEPNGAPNFTIVFEIYSADITIPVVEEVVARVAPPKNLTLAIDDGLGDSECIGDPNGTTFYLNFTNMDVFSERANVTLVAELSDQVVYQSASDGGIYNHTAREIVWTIDSLGPNTEDYRFFTVVFISNSSTLLTDASIASIEGNVTQAQLNTSICLAPDWRTYVNLPPVAQCKSVVEAADDECLVHVAPHLVDGGCYDPENATLSSNTSISNCSLGTTAVTLSISDGQLGDECQANVTVEDWTPPPPPSVKTSTFYLWPPTQELFAIRNVSSLHGDSLDNCSGENIITSFMGCSTTDHQGTLPIDCFYDAITDTLFVRAEQLTVSRRYLRRRLKSSKDTKASKASSKKKSQKKMSKASSSNGPMLPRARPRNPPPIRPRIEPTHTYHVRLDLADEAGNIRPTTFIVHAPHSSQEVQNLGLGNYQRLDTNSGNVLPVSSESRNRRRKHYRTQSNTLI